VTDRPQLHEPFEQAVRVEPADIDALGHVNNTVYLRWVQDVAVAHWRAAAAPEHQAELSWLVVRHEIDYKHPAVLGDEIVVRTWVGAAEGLRFERHTEVLRHADRKLLARARTLWCPIDARTLRPCRVPADVREQFSTGRAG
jgi:acyl-CoA thioester hydrolase